MENPEYNWTFASVGGAVRVRIQSGADIAHLGELDRKMWTVLSCPTQNLEFDAKTLSYIDNNGDGIIRVDEVMEAGRWITSLLRNPDDLLEGKGEMELAAFNTDNPEGAALLKSARQILHNLHLSKSAISIEDTSDNAKIFAETPFNGDGVITEFSSAELAELIKKIAEISGGSPDRSGVQGINAEQIEAFYTACADYAAWQKSAAKNYGETAAEALAAIEAVKGKVEDFFMRCKLIDFNKDASAAVDVDIEKIKAISAEDLALKADEIASYPLSRPNAEGLLNLSEGINPVWQAAVGKLKALIFPKAEAISEAEWNKALADFAPYTAWLGEKKGAEVEALGFAEIQKILADGKKDELLALIEKDKELEAEALSIETVDKVLHLHRDIFKFLNNYVVFKDFYEKDLEAIFQAGRLFIDQRRCDLCVKVSDMGKQADMAGLSRMYILYCACTSKTTGKSFVIAAVLTNGDIDGLRVGKNAIFYDRAGEVYDATVIKIIDNSVSLKQAWWAPYRKFGNWINEKVNKRLSEKNDQGFASMTNAANNAPAPGAPAAPAKPAFDIAKFAGIFAALGLALGFIVSALTSLAAGAAKLWPWKLLLVILGIMLIISLPSVIITWLRLRRRNLGPILNSNGWAINASTIVNTKFGKTLTKLVKYPSLASVDPEEAKKARRRRAVWGVVLLFLLAGGIFLGYKLIMQKKAAKAKAEAAAVAAAAAESAPAPADSTLQVVTLEDAPQGN